MTTNERILYHQIHPAKLAADGAASVASVAAFWAHRPWLGLAAALIVPVATTALVLRYADLGRLKRSRTGAYVKRYMTTSAQGQRLAGFGVLCYGAWSRSFLVAVLGAALIVHAWTMGLLIPRDAGK